jgi:hypothetical protein
LLVIVTESFNAWLEIETSADTYHEYITGEKGKLFGGIEKIIIKQKSVAKIENR